VSFISAHLQLALPPPGYRVSPDSYVTPTCTPASSRLSYLTGKRRETLCTLTGRQQRKTSSLSLSQRRRAILFVSALRLFERSKSLPGVSHLHPRVPQTRRHFITGPITPGVTSRVPSTRCHASTAPLSPGFSPRSGLLYCYSIFYCAFTGTLQLLLLMFACITFSSQVGEFVNRSHARSLRAIRST